MTLVVAAQGHDFIVASADSRGTFGDISVAFSSYDVMLKLAVVSPHVVVQTYGAAEIGDNVLEEFKKEVKAEDDGISSISTKLSGFCLNRWQQFFSNVPFQYRPVVAYGIAGLDKNETDNKFGIPRIYTIDSRTNFVPAFHRYGWSAGGVPMFAIYLLGRRYHPDMPIDQLSALVAYVMAETATQDLRVGGAIRMKRILPHGVEDVTEREISELLASYYEGKLQ
jgi:20S proteasome alpha/beta subunit